MQKSTKKYLVLIVIAVIALTALTLCACDGLFGGGNDDQPEQLRIENHHGQLPRDVSRDTISNYIKVIFIDKKGAEHELSPSDYQIVEFTQSYYDENMIQVVISYNGMMKSEHIPLAIEPTLSIAFTSFTNPFEEPEVFYRDFKAEPDSNISDSALPTPSAKNNSWKFLYWCYDRELKQRFDGSVANLMNKGMMLYAKWDYIIQAGATQGLQYEHNGMGIAVTGIGTATDKDIVIPSVYLDFPVVEIRENVFKDLDITSIKMPSVETIAQNAFNNCTELSEVTFSDNLHFIGERAFYGCSSLTEVVLPETTYGVMPEAFSNCTQLTKFIFTPSGEGGFEDSSYLDGCPNLITVAAPQTFLYNGSFDNVTDLEVTNGGVYMEFLQNFPAIQTLTIGEKVEFIGKIEDMPLTKVNFNAINCQGFISSDNTGVFSNFTNFPEFVIGDKVEIIPDCMFYYCDNITSIVLPASVKRVGVDSFANSSLQTLTILGNSLNCDYNAFNRCRFVKVTAPISCLNRLNASIQKLEITNGETLSGLSFSTLTELILPETLTSLGDVSFDRCNNSIFNIVDGVKYLGSKTNPKMALISVTEDATDLQLSADVKLIHSNAFLNATNLKSVDLDSANDKFAVHNGILYGNNQKDLLFVPRRNFPGNIQLLEGVTKISVGAFKDCTSIMDIAIPDTITSIDAHAFEGCTSFTTIHIPYGVTTLGNYAFSGCTALTGISLSSTLTSIGSHAFEGCTQLKKINIPHTVTTIESDTFSGCTSLTDVSLSTATTTIKSYAFDGCSSLENINFSQTVTSIGDYAFRNCESLATITLRPSMKTLGNYCFSGCSSLTSIVFSGTATQCNALSYGNGVFKGVAVDHISCSNGTVGIITI
ncbi:MAG: leucine-rich repeat domain-containing protein [Clostridia bacterium]|nr:leucine-rich repeat domain-containing protein [Clostridia bacterium]